MTFEGQSPLFFFFFLITQHAILCTFIAFQDVKINGQEYHNTASSDVTISLCTIVDLSVQVSNKSGKLRFKGRLGSWLRNVQFRRRVKRKAVTETSANG